MATQPLAIPLLASSAQTTTQTSSDISNTQGFRGVKVVMDTTTVSAGSVVLTIQGKDTISGKYYTLLAGAAVTTAVTNVYTVYPGITASANVSASDVLPAAWRVSCSGNGSSQTYSVVATLIP